MTNAATEQPPSAQGVRKAFVTRAAPTGPRKVVILGTGWAAARLAQDLDPAKHTIWVVSPRNHMVFTPLLASTTVGTLDFRSVTVSMRNIQPALNTGPHRYVTALAENIDLEKKQVVCRAADETDETFSVRYDDLCIATGAQGSTFGIPGVEEHAFFLRDVANADAIRNRIVRNISLAQIPECKEEERRKLLSFVIVGGGPTGVEFAGELANLVNEDLKRIACRIYPLIRITLIEGDRVLGTFNPNLQWYASRTLRRAGVEIIKAFVSGVDEDSITLSDGSTIPFGVLVWSTGVGPTEFIDRLPLAKSKDGRLSIDGHLRCQDASGKTLQNVFSLGDCASNNAKPLPTLAQVAEQQGKYLAKQMNASLAGEEERAAEWKDAPEFAYKQLGSMAGLTSGTAVMELGKTPDNDRSLLSIKGLASFLAWRSAYLTKLGSLQNRLYVVLNWTTTLFLGRDLTRW